MSATADRSLTTLVVLSAWPKVSYKAYIFAVAVPKDGGIYLDF